MDDFLIAGSTSGETDERLLHQVVQIAGYTSTIRALVNSSFRFCSVHGTPIPKSGRRASHANLTVVDGCGAWPTFVGGGPSAF